MAVERCSLVVLAGVAFESAKINESGVEIDQRNRVFGNGSGFCYAGGADDEGDARTFLPQRVFKEEVFLTHVPTVVAG